MSLIYDLFIFLGLAIFGFGLFLWVGIGPALTAVGICGIVAGVLGHKTEK